MDNVVIADCFWYYECVEERVLLFLDPRVVPGSKVLLSTELEVN